MAGDKDEYIRKMTGGYLPEDPSFTVRDVFSFSAASYGDKVALISPHEDREVTFTALNNRANKLANALRTELGVAYRDIVAICSPNSTRFVELYGANSKIGATTAPVPNLLKPKELPVVLNNIGARVLFLHPNRLEAFLEVEAECRGVQRVVLLGGQDLEGQAAVVCDERGDKFCRYEALIAPQPESEPEARVESYDIYCLFLTSGTTGAPKSVMKNHRSILAGYQRFPFPMRICFFNNLAWIGASQMVLWLFLSGGLAIIQDGYEREKHVNAMIKYQCTISTGLPLFMRDLSLLPMDQVEQLREHIKLITFGGGVIPAEIIVEVVRRFPSATVLHGYGSSESGSLMMNMIPAFSSDTLTEKERRMVCSVGKPVFGTRVKIVDPEGKELPQGEAGEIVCQGQGVMTGYFNNPEATKEALRGGWLHMGDMGYFDEDGQLHICGRIKNVIIHELGVNVFPREIEDVLSTVEGVKDVTVVGCPHPDKIGERVVVFAVREDGAGVTEENLLAKCKENLADFKQPHAVFFLPEIPYSANGKALKRELLEMDGLRSKVWA